MWLLCWSLGSLLVRYQSYSRIIGLHNPIVPQLSVCLVPSFCRIQVIFKEINISIAVGVSRVLHIKMILPLTTKPYSEAMEEAWTISI